MFPELEHGEGLFYDGEVLPTSDSETLDFPETLASPLVFDDTLKPVLAYYNQDDIRELLSCLMNGAYLTYPDEWQAKVWKFQQWLDYPVLIDEDEFTLEFIRMFGNNWNAQLYVVGTVHEPATFDNTFGNPKTSVRSGWMTASGLTGRYLRTFIYFDEPVTIYSANFDYYAILQETPTNSQRDLVFFNESDVQLGLARSTSNTWVQNSWQNFSYSNPSGLANVSYIFSTLTARKSTWTDSSLTKLWLDNIRINP